MKICCRLFLVVLIIFVITSQGIGAPIRPFGPVDVAGVIGDLHWYPEKKEKAIRGMSGSAGVDRTMPAHFLLTLRVVEGVDSQTAVAMTRYFDSLAFKSEEKNFMPTFVVLKINHSDKNYLKKGMKIKVFADTQSVATKGEPGHITQESILSISLVRLTIFSVTWRPPLNPPTQGERCFAPTGYSVRTLPRGHNISMCGLHAWSTL